MSSLPLVVGEYSLDNETNVTFFYQSESEGSVNLISTQGKIIIDEAANGAVKGRMLAFYDESNRVNGTFTLSVCD